MDDKAAIRETVENWVVWRDAGDWDRFATVWHADGWMSATWFQGPAGKFIEVSREGFERGVNVLHALNGWSCDLDGTRAVSQVKMNIFQRAPLDGVQVDVICWGRFYDFFEKRDGRWGIVRRQPIYEKDRLDPVIPGTAPAGFYDGLKLEGPKTGSAFLAFRLSKIGRQSVPMIYSLSDEEKQLRAEYRRWLEG